MKKLLTLLLISISLISFSQIPNKFKIEEYAVSIGTDFKIPNGYIDEQIVSLTSNFTLKVGGKFYGKSKEHLISIGSKIDIFNERNQKIGMVHEQIFSGAFTFGVYSKYTIYDSKGRKIAYSEKHELMSTSFTIKDMSGKTICKISRPMINLFSDTWTVEFKQERFDKRLFIFIPCYKTLRDNEDD